MSQNQGTLIGAAIRPNDSNDPIASAFNSEIKGGHHHFNTLAERDSLIEARREFNMWATVHNDSTASNNKTYKLVSGTVDSNIMNNGNWIEQEFGSSFSGTSKTIPMFSPDGKTLVNSNLKEINAFQWLFGQYANLRTINLSASRSFIFQDKSGIVALTSDIVAQPGVIGGGYAVYQANTAYTTAGNELIYYINSATQEQEFYKVNNNFTSANPLNLAADIAAGNITKVSVSGTKIEEFEFAKLYFQNSVVWSNSGNLRYFYIAINTTFEKPLTDSNKWKAIGVLISDNENSGDNLTWSIDKLVSEFSKKQTNILTEDKFWKGNSSNVAEEIPTNKIYHTYVGDVLLNELYLVTNGYNSTVALGSKVESLHQVAEKTLIGWVISKKNTNKELVAELDITDTNFFSSGKFNVSTFENADVIKVVGNTTLTSNDFSKIEGLTENSVVTFEIGKFESLNTDTYPFGTTEIDAIIMESGINITATEGHRLTFVRKGTYNKHINTSS